MTSQIGFNRHRGRTTLPFVAVAGASILLAACGSSSKTSTPPLPTSVPAAAGATPTTAGSSASDATVTVKVASVPGLGPVLVNGDGRTLYILQSEKGGKVTCTSVGGCTTIWPPAVVPSGISNGIAGSGVQAALLGTVTSPSGEIRLTYGGWPLYTFVSDKGPGSATGQALKDQFGLWLALSASGAPITTTASASSPTTAPSAPATSPATSPQTSPATTAPASGGAGF